MIFNDIKTFSIIWKELVELSDCPGTQYRPGTQAQASKKLKTVYYMYTMLGQW